jgi:hypothetical protein
MNKMPEFNGGPSSKLADTLSPTHRGSSDTGRGRRESRQAETAQRLAELRAEMKANQEQIEQLHEAHRAVHQAVSGITATQELLRVSPEQNQTQGTSSANFHTSISSNRRNSCTCHCSRFGSQQKYQEHLQPTQGRAWPCGGAVETAARRRQAGRA